MKKYRLTTVHHTVSYSIRIRIIKVTFCDSQLSNWLVNRLLDDMPLKVYDSYLFGRCNF